MEEWKIGTPPQRVGTPAEHPHPESRSISLGGSELRIDSPHVSNTIGAAPAAAPPRANSQLLLESVKILEQLQQQDAELMQRQTLMEERIAAFENEKRAFLAQQLAMEATLEERRQKLESDEAELAGRLADTQDILVQIEAARVALQQERVDVERRRAAIRSELLAELQDDRDAVDAARQQLATEIERVQGLGATLETKLHEATVEAERLVQSERERLWQVLLTEWEDRRAQFQAEHDAWLQTVQAEKVEIEREKAFYEAAVRNAESDFAAARLEQANELQTLREQQIAELQAERDQVIQRIEAERQEWEQTHAEQQAHLQAEQDEWNKTRTLQLNELKGERAVIENRIRFQQDHLEKLRSDLERSQNEHRRERQIERQRIEDDSRQVVRRMRQIDLYRASIDEREKSLERERDVLEKSRRAFSSSADVDRTNLQREQNAWQTEKQVQQSELLRQQELFASHAENLESRRIRLERLRTELEETHRSTLEMRLAVEEAWVELTQKAGQEVARERVEQVRNTLVGYYRQLHEGIVEQRREHLEAQTKFERLRAEFHDERQKLMEWISTRDQELKVGEERLRLEATDAAMRDSAWQAARDRWMQEKAEAEQVIRKLLAELGNQHRDPLLTLNQLSSLGMSTPDFTPTEAITPPQPEDLD